MSPVELLEHPLAAAATLALVHFLWQGVAIAAALVAVVELLGIRRPQTRYLCSLAALVLMALCPLVTLAVVGSGESSGEQSQVQSPTSNVEAPALTTHHSPLTTHSVMVAAQPYVLIAWLAGVAFFGCRLLMGVIGVRRLRSQRLPLPKELSERVELLARRLGMRARSMVFLSRRVGEAMAVGVVKPLVLLPVTWASEMPLVMLEAVIAHELAHLQRRDLWVVLLERVVETLLFYHPAVWWLSSRLRAERELCCDELAVALTGRRLEYVQALESVARWGARVEPLFAAGIRGERNMQLLQRVRNVLGLSVAGESSRLWPAGLVALLLPLAAWGWSAGLIAPQPSVAVADDDDNADEKEVRKEGAKERDDDDDGDEKEARKDKKGDDDDGDEKKGRKEGDKEGDDDDDKAEAKDRGDKDGDRDEKEVRKDGDKPEAAVRKREGVKKEGPKDGEVRKEGAKDPPRKVIKEGIKDPPRKVIKDGESGKVIKEGAPAKAIKDGEGKLAELAAMVKKLMAENERLRAELAEMRGVKLPAKIKEGASEKEAFIKKPGADKEAARDKEAAATKEDFLRQLGAEKDAVREKEAFKRAIAEKEAFAREANRKREIAEKDELAKAIELKRAIAEKDQTAKAIELKRAIAEKEEAAARERKEREGAERKEAELRERKIKEVKAHAAEAEERARAAAEKAEAAERAAKEKAAKEKEDKQ